MATLIGAWIGRPRKTEEEKPTVLGVAVRTPDGTQIHFDYRYPKDLDQILPRIQKILGSKKTKGRGKR